MDLTGNPFVDTGLMVLTALAEKNCTSDLDFADVRRVFGDGEQLARDNKALKCFTMVFGTNGPLTQPAYKKLGKNKEVYLSIVRRIIEFAEGEGHSGRRCDLTGLATNFDFHSVCAGALREAGLPVPEKKWIGRDWVPLGGSLGNDAQALPVASRPLHVSALALFALQYLPLGVILFQGRLACFQCAEDDLALAWVADIVKQNRDRLALGETQILGKGRGSGGAIELLMRCFEDVSYTHGGEASLWLFSNSGAVADCQLENVPENALAFIYEASKTFGSEIRRLVASEPKDGRHQMFECIRGGRDYGGLYAFKKLPGSSPEFYELYQERIRGATSAGLEIARKLAQAVLSGAEKKRLKEIRKPEFLRSNVGRNYVRKQMIQQLSPQEYDSLFPSQRRPVRVEPAGWDHLRFYLSSPNEDKRQLFGLRLTMKTTHPKIVQIAETYRDVDPKKIKSVLDRMAQRKIGVRWLQDKFCRLAEKHPDWNLGDWDEFVCDEDGKPTAFELLFQIRLYLSNLYREVTLSGKGEAA
jgi:hypothetical protein